MRHVDRVLNCDEAKRCLPGHKENENFEINRAGNLAKSFVEAALRQGLHLETELINLGKSLSQEGRRDRKGIQMGWCLSNYLSVNSNPFPVTRTQFLDYMKSHVFAAPCLFKTSKNMSDSLAYYELRSVMVKGKPGRK